MSNPELDGPPFVVQIDASLFSIHHPSRPRPASLEHVSQPTTTYTDLIIILADQQAHDTRTGQHILR